MRLFAVAAALLIAAPVWAQAQPLLDQGRERTEAFLSGDLEGIWQDMSPELHEALGTLENFEAFHEQVTAGLGEEESVLNEQALLQGGYGVYLRTGEWSGTDAPVVVQWAFDSEGTIAGFFIRPQQQALDSDYLDYQTQSDLRLPFDGEWHVFWGGRTIEQNYHAANREQRFAYDFIVRENGQSHSGDADDPESYFCWGREILAPADGQVVGVVTDLPDQPIGASDPENPAGNHVILALAEGEFAFLGHMQQGSIRVQNGDEVAQGDVLGLCGNSGNTSEPHLHFHLQTTPDLNDGEGLPAQFQNYVADGDPVDRGEPEAGQTVEHAGG